MTTLFRTATFSLLLLIAVLSAGVTALAEDRPQPAASCVAGPTTLCLNDQRFKLDVQWKDFAGNTGVGQAVPLTSDTGYFWFFSSNNVELVVKVLDGRVLNNHFWVFFGALSNVEYTMRVTDTQTGSVETYFNPSGQFASVGDTEAFSMSGKVSSVHRYVEVNDSSMFVTPFTLRSPTEANVAAQALSTCVGTETSLCLNGGRFRVEVNWKDFQGGTGVGKAISLTSDTGYFWFFNSANVELVVKVLDARTLNNRFWVFYGALSNVEYEMTVTDTLTGNVNTYLNPSGRFASTGDTGAFPAGHSVTARLDQSRAVSADIPTTGGTISATASDGTVFTLAVPNDALLSEARITMTPVTAIDRLPLSGGLAAAVDLQPTGLRLFQFATLTIAPARAVPFAEEITFAWRGSGEEFFLYPPELDTSNISMKVMHFSGYGVGRGSPADEAAQQQRVPASPEDALDQRLQEVVANRRRAQSRVGALADDDYARRYQASLLDYYKYVLKEKVELAKRDCKKARAVAPLVAYWIERTKGPWAGDCCWGVALDVTLELVEALAKCYNESFDWCVSANDPDQVREMLSFYGALERLDGQLRVNPAKIERCARFELNFQSTVQIAFSEGSFNQTVLAGVPIRIFPNGRFEWFTGTGQLHTSKVEYKGACPTSTVGGTSVFGVVKLTLDINFYEGNAPPPDLMSMQYNPGEGVNIVSILGSATCEPYPGLPDAGWWDVYRAFHANEQIADIFVAREWKRGASDPALYAEKEYKSGDNEATYMLLWHFPDKP